MLLSVRYHKIGHFGIMSSKDAKFGYSAKYLKIMARLCHSKIRKKLIQQNYNINVIYSTFRSINKEIMFFLKSNFFEIHSHTSKIVPLSEI